MSLYKYHRPLSSIHGTLVLVAFMRTGDIKEYLIGQFRDNGPYAWAMKLIINRVAGNSQLLRLIRRRQNKIERNARFIRQNRD
jgi:hypothetical protein